MALGTSGGGGSAGAIQAGKANVKLGVTDDVTPKLRELKEKFKQFGEETSKELGKAGRGNLFGEFFKGGVMGATAAVTSAAIEEAGKGLKELIFGSKTLDDTTKAWSESLKEVAETIQTIKTRFGEAIEDTPADLQRGVIDQEISKLQEQLKAVEKERARIREGFTKFSRMTDSNTTEGQLANFGNWARERFSLGERTSVQKEKAVAGIREFDDLINKTTEDIRLLERQRKKLDDNPAATALGDQIGKAREDAFFNEKMADPEISDRMKQLIKLQGELQKIRGEGARQNIELGLKELANVVKVADAEEKAFRDKLKQMEQLKEQRKAQADAMLGAAKDIEFGRLTEGLSPEAARMARLVEQGLSNDQIAQLQRLERIARATASGGSDFTSRGGFASSDLSRSLGIADQWTQMKKEAELTNQKLDEIRGVMGQLERLLGFK